MTDTITYTSALADLEARLDRTADEIFDVLVREGLDEDQRYTAMQKVFLELDKARVKGVAEIDRVFAQVEMKH